MREYHFYRKSISISSAPSNRLMPEPNHKGMECNHQYDGT